MTSEQAVRAAFSVSPACTYAEVQAVEVSTQFTGPVWVVKLWRSARPLPSTPPEKVLEFPQLVDVYPALVPKAEPS